MSHSDLGIHPPGNARIRGVRLLPRLLVIIALLGPGALPSPGNLQAGDPERREKRDPGLLQAVDAIQQAFRGVRTAPLRDLLPTGGKVYLSSESLGAEPGFYSGDQAEALLRRSFRSLRSLEFSIHVERSRGGGGSGGVVICPASWKIARGTARREIRLRFLLASRAERWTLREIREIR